MFSRIWKLISSSFAIWGKARASLMSAAMTYFTMLSLAPLLVIAIAIAGLFYGDRIAQEEIIDQVTRYTTERVAGTVAELIANTSRPESGLVAGGISIVILVFAASGVFSQLQDTFNEIWDVPDEQRQGIWLQVKTRLIGIIMVFVAGVLLVTTLGLSTAIATVSNLFHEIPSLGLWLEWVDRGVSFLLIPLILALSFWLIPRTKIHWNDVWPAAILTALLLSLSRYLIKLYLEFSTTSEVYGAAGSLVVLLVWIYMGGLVLFYGAAFSRSWTECFGSRYQSQQQTADRNVQDRDNNLASKKMTS